MKAKASDLCTASVMDFHILNSAILILQPAPLKMSQLKTHVFSTISAAL